MSSPATKKLSESEVPTLFTLIFKMVDYINLYWNFYVLFSAILVGWLFTSQEPWGIRKKIFATLFYLIALVMNLCPLITVYIYFERSLSELREEAKLLETHTEEFRKILEKASAVGGWGLAATVHLIVDPIIIYCIWSLK